MPMPDFGAGGVLFAADLQQLSDQIDSLTGPGWTTYAPVWSSSGTQPVKNNGTLTGRYRRAANADLVVAEFTLTIGSTTTIGTGTYWISVPVTPSANAVINGVGVLYMLDSGTLDKAGVIKFEDNTKFTPVATSGGVVTSTNPHTWATGDILKGIIEYEPA